MIWFCKSQSVPWNPAELLPSKRGKKIKFYSEQSLNNSWEFQPPAYNLFTKNLFEGSYLGEFYVALMFASYPLKIGRNMIEKQIAMPTGEK